LNLLLKVIALGFIINFGVVLGFYILDENNILEWNEYFVIPIGATNGIIMAIYTIKSQKKKQMEKLR
jgi:hypothetical protein